MSRRHLVLSSSIAYGVQEIATVLIHPHGRGARRRIALVLPDTAAINRIMATRENAIRLATWPLDRPVQLETFTGYMRTDGMLDTVPMWYVIRGRMAFERAAAQHFPGGTCGHCGNTYGSLATAFCEEHPDVDELAQLHKEIAAPWPRPEVQGYYPPRDRSFEELMLDDEIATRRRLAAPRIERHTVVGEDVERIMLVGQAQEDIKAGDTLAIDPKTGRVRRTP